MKKFILISGILMLLSVCVFSQHTNIEYVICTKCGKKWYVKDYGSLPATFKAMKDHVCNANQNESQPNQSKKQGNSNNESKKQENPNNEPKKQENSNTNTQMNFPQYSSASSGCITVYTPEGYFVKATNNCNHACSYSINYDLLGYDRNDSLVSITNKTYTNATTYANKQADEIFTTPVDPNKKIAYWIRITGVYDVKDFPK